MTSCNNGSWSFFCGGEYSDSGGTLICCTDNVVLRAEGDRKKSAIHVSIPNCFPYKVEGMRNAPRFLNPDKASAAILVSGSSMLTTLGALLVPRSSLLKTLSVATGLPNDGSIDVLGKVVGTEGKAFADNCPACHGCARNSPEDLKVCASCDWGKPSDRRSGRFMAAGAGWEESSCVGGDGKFRGAVSYAGGCSRCNSILYGARGARVAAVLCSPRDGGTAHDI